MVPRQRAEQAAEAAGCGAAPKIEEGTTIKKIDKEARLNEIAKGAELKKTEVLDKSAPKLPAAAKADDIKAVVGEVAKSHDLKHVETVDKAAPKIEDGIKIKKTDPKQRLAEIEKGVDLKHPDEIKDRSEPIVEKDVHIGKNKHKDLLSEVEKKAGSK